MNNETIPENNEEVLTPELKKEWLKKVSVTEFTEVYSPKRKRYNTKLHTAPQCIQEDYEINLTAVTVGKEFLYNIDNKYKNDKKFILQVMSLGYNQPIYDNLSYSLREDEEVLKACLQRKEKPYFLPEKILNNKELVLELMKKYDVLHLLNKRYDLDKDVITVELEKNPSYFNSLKKRMHNYFSSPKRKQFLLSLFKKHPYNIGSLYESLPQSHQEDLDFVHELLSSSPSNIAYIAKSLLSDKGFMTYAIEKYNCDTKYCPKEIIEDIDIAKLSVEKDGVRLLKNYKGHAFSGNIELIELALKTYKNFDLLPRSLYDNKELVLKFLQANRENCSALFNATNIYHDDKDVMRIAMQYNVDFFNHSRVLQKDTELCRLAINLSNDAKYLNDTLVEDRNLVIELIENSKDNCCQLFNQAKAVYLYNDDKEIAELVTNHEPTLIEHFYNLKSDKEFVKKTMRKGLRDIAKVDQSLYYDEEIAKAFITLNTNNYNKLPLEIKNKEEVALKAVAYGIQAPALYNTQFKHNVDFYKKAIKQNISFYNNNFPEDLKFNTEIVLVFCKNYNSFYNTMPSFITERYNTNVIEDVKKQVENEILKNKLESDLENSLENKPLTRKIKV